MTAAGVLAPLVSARTYRRAVHLLLGGVIALPYFLVGAIFWQMLADSGNPRSVTLAVLLVAAAITASPPFLAGARALGIDAARSLLEADLPAADPTERLDRETRLRSALWFALHLLAGSLVGTALVTAVPMALIFILQQLGVGAEVLAGFTFGPLDSEHPIALTVTGVLLLIALLYAIAGLGALAAMMAPTLLGPSQRERIAALEARAAQLAQRNRLARELHDSVGHALTVTTLQAGAAAQLLDSDPQFVRRALRAIEDAGRGAMEDLDYVLGVLREEADGRAEPDRTLRDLDRVIADSRAAGLAVSVKVIGSIEGLPAAVSREGRRRWC
jgi:signal transduction histidine kinase